MLFLHMPPAVSILRIRKLADKSVPREVRFDPRTGERFLIDPATGERSPRPFLGIEFVDDPPEATVVAQNFVRRGRDEGWIEILGEETVTRSSGPPSEPVSSEHPPHVFLHAEAIVFKTVHGDIRYRVTRNPDKWPDEKDGEHGFGGEVLWTFELQLDEGG